MSDTVAIPLTVLAEASGGHHTGQPLCPSCHVGRLHPYKVTITLSMFRDRPVYGAAWLEGWIAKCVGNRHDVEFANRLYAGFGDEEYRPPKIVEGCGFVMAMSPRTDVTFQQRGR